MIQLIWSKTINFMYIYIAYILDTTSKAISRRIISSQEIACDIHLSSSLARSYISWHSSGQACFLQWYWNLPYDKFLKKNLFSNTIFEWNFLRNFFDNSKQTCKIWCNLMTKLPETTWPCRKFLTLFFDSHD